MGVTVIYSFMGFPLWYFPSSLALFISSAVLLKKIYIYIIKNVFHVTSLPRARGASQTPWNMECALASMLHKISKPETFPQPDRFSHTAFHIPGVTQYRHCRLDNKQRILQETSGKWSLRIFHRWLKLHSPYFSRQSGKVKMGQKKKKSN